jgi:hypothetical protein
MAAYRKPKAFHKTARGFAAQRVKGSKSKE